MTGRSMWPCRRPAFSTLDLRRQLSERYSDPMAKRTRLPIFPQWRGAAFYFLVFTLVGIALGVLGELTEWSDGIAMAVTVVVGGPISLAAAHDARNWFEGSREGRRTGRRPSA